MLFGKMRASWDPEELRGGVKALQGTVSGDTPSAVFEQVLHPSVDDLRAAQDIYTVGKDGFNSLYDAVDGWHKKAGEDVGAGGGYSDVAIGESAKTLAAKQRVITDHANAGTEPSESDSKALADAQADYNKRAANRLAADANLEKDLARIERELNASMESLGIKPDVDVDKDNGPATPTPYTAPTNPGGGNPGNPTPAGGGGTEPVPGAVPGAGAPKLNPGGDTPVPGTTPKTPATEAAIKDLLNQAQQGQGQPTQAQPAQQQQQPAAAMAAPTGGQQAKPATGKDPREGLNKLMNGAGYSPDELGGAPAAVAAGIVPDLGGAPAAAGPAPAAPAPKVGGGSFTGATTTGNVSGGQTASPKVTLSAAEPVQPTTSPAQRTGGTPAAGAPVAPLGGVPGQGGAGGGKAQEKVPLYRAMTPQERNINGKIATEDEAVRGGTIIRGDHDNDTNPEKQGPRQR